jgi:outer membrane protein assembly factor BamE (lipoprotein component of BamABCDE complex)
LQGRGRGCLEFPLVFSGLKGVLSLSTAPPLETMGLWPLLVDGNSAAQYTGGIAGGDAMSWFSILLICGVLVGGCTTERFQTQLPKQGSFNLYFRLQNVNTGMTRSEVEAVMGPPQIREAGDYRKGHFVFYYYRTHSMDYDGSNTVRGGYTPLVFQKDVLVGMGTRDYLKAVDRPWMEPAEKAPWQRSW